MPGPVRSARVSAVAGPLSRAIHCVVQSPLTEDHLADAARRLARAGGELALQWAGSRAASMKADNSPVTDADHAVQAVILDALAVEFPQHAILVEETVADPDRHEGRQAEYCWVIDPIDGTRNFARNSRTFATSVAVLRAGMPVAGAIYDARTQEVCWAARGGGAWAGRRRLGASDAALDDRTILAISSFRRKPVPAEVRGLLDFVMFRNLGSLCLHTVEVAAGEFDGLYSHEAKAWDIAAGCLLIEEAGGLATGPDGRPLWPLDVERYSGEDMPLLAGGKRMHAMVREWLEKRS